MISNEHTTTRVHIRFHMIKFIWHEVAPDTIPNRRMISKTTTREQRTEQQGKWLDYEKRNYTLIVAIFQTRSAWTKTNRRVKQGNAVLLSSPVPTAKDARPINQRLAHTLKLKLRNLLSSFQPPLLFVAGLVVAVVAVARNWLRSPNTWY
jgi:hypothetical protein